MAWQLVYTSAPRLLDAGRSGFGTVARHRTISPLLVSAIERLSQFARLPGLETERVIYSHRIIPIGGSRFHVLTCIRDAGADYTGRTNHIAHHLVIEPREIAALGTRGPSPADVLLAMPWLTAWNESPHWFETSDEVGLSGFVPTGGNGAAWAQLTGNPAHAWLLASGSASRGAYVIAPPSADVRRLFADSLRLASERAWQIPFTTSLQPSDEAADFRWIGVEAESPLLAVENAGRQVLDLTAPATLPVPELPRTTPPPSVFSSRTTRLSEDMAPVSSSVEKSAPAVPRPALRTEPQEDPFAKFEVSRPIPWKWIGIAAGVMALGVACWILVQFFEALSLRDEISAKLKNREYFTPKTIEELTAGRLAELRSKRSFPEAAITVLDEAVKSLGDAPKSETSHPDVHEKLEAAAKSAGINLPVDLGALAEELIALPNEFKKVAEYKATKGDAFDAELTKLAEGLKAKFPRPIPMQSKKGAEERVAILVISKRAEILRTLLERNRHPQEHDHKWFQTRVDKLDEQLKPLPKEPTRELQTQIAELRQVLEEWTKSEAPKVPGMKETEYTGRLPEWLKTERLAKKTGTTNGKPIVPPEQPTKATPSSKTPLYFFRGLDALSNTTIPELESGATYFLGEIRLEDSPPTLTLRPKELVPSAGGEKGSINLFIDHTAQGTAFSVKNKKISAEADIRERIKSKTITSPFFLVAKKGADASELVRIFIVPNEPLNQPLFGTKIQGITWDKNRDSLKIEFEELASVGSLMNPLKVELPTAWANPPTKMTQVTFAAGGFFLGTMKERLAQDKNRIEQEISSLEKKLKEIQEYTKESRFKKLKDEFIKISELGTKIEEEKARREEAHKGKKQEKPTDLPEEEYLRSSGAIEKQYGGCIAAFSHLGGVLRAAFLHADELSAAGIALYQSQPDKFGDRIKDARKWLGIVSPNINNQELKKKYLGGLEKLQEMAGVVLDEERPAREKERVRIADTLEKWKEERRKVDSHPLMLQTVPGGIYRLLTVAEGKTVGDAIDVPLVVIRIAP